MCTVINLPNPRALSAVRQATVNMASRCGANESTRLHALARAARQLADGSSVAWAIEIARQDLRDAVRAVRIGGGHAA